MALENKRLEAFLRAVPIEYCGWNKDGVQALSSGFCTVLGVDSIENLQDIQNALTPGDAAALEGLYDRLHELGEHFDIGVSTVDNKRALKLFGKRGAEFIDGSVGEVFTVLWVMDITDLAHAALKSVDMLSMVERRENELRAILNSIPVPIWARDEVLDLVWCNKAYAKLVEETPAAVVAEKKELPVAGSQKGTAPRMIAQRAISNSAAEQARLHIISGGDRRLLEITETPLTSAEKRMVGCAIDVTREEELRKEAERQAASNREALEQLHSAIAMFDVETRLEFYNAGWEQLWGVESAFLDSRPKLGDLLEKLRELRKLPEQADFKQFKQHWAGMFTSLLQSHEEMLYLPDGTMLRLIALPRPEGGLVMTVEDVTSRVELETSYNTLIAVQRETLDSLAEGLAVFGEDGRLKLSNPAYARLWGFKKEELDSAPHIARMIDRKKNYFNDSDWPVAQNILMANGLEREQRKGSLERLDGTVLEYSVVPLPDGNILNAWFDITDKIKAERALIEKNAALEEAEKLKTDFLANVSYQLRTPLNAMIGFAEMLDQQYFGPLNDRQKEYTSGMMDAGQRLVGLINDILDLSTIEAGYLTIYPEEVKVADLLQNVADLTQEWAQRQSLSIRVKDGGAGTIVADERRVRQALLSLVSNAIHYTPSGGSVTLFARETDNGIELGVQDTGIGISPEDLQRVFTPFEKIHSRDMQRRSGAGLGLALVKSIVELHGGIVSIESIEAPREGHGTTVLCLLPPVAVQPAGKKD